MDPTALYLNVVGLICSTILIYKEYNSAAAVSFFWLGTLILEIAK